MVKIILLIIISFTGYSQTIVQTAFFPIYDSLGQAVYIRKSEVNNYKHPKKDTKIFCFNQKLDTLGYWIGTKLRFISVIPKKKGRPVPNEKRPRTR